MTTALAIIAGVVGLAAGILWLLWRGERRKRISAEQAAKLQAIRADGEARLREKSMQAEQRWHERNDELEAQLAASLDKFKARREEIYAIAGDSEAVAAEVNRLLGHTEEGE